MEARKGKPVIRTLQLGMSWFPEQAGNGLDRVYHALVHHLPALDVDVRAFVMGAGADPSSRHPVRFVAADTASLPRRWYGMRQAMRQELRQRTPDLVCSHFALYTAPVLPLISEWPLVVHFHGPWALESQVEGASAAVVRAKALLERAVYHRGTHFIVLSKAFRQVLCRHYGIREERVSVVPGGVDVERFATVASRPEARRRLGWPLGRPIVLTVRRLTRRMGLEGLIQAMTHLREYEPDVMLYIAGKGPLEDELRARIDSLDLTSHVQLLGFVPDDILPLVYAAADLSIVPTTAFEGFGLVTVESLAAGTPVLVAPQGGLPEVVRPLSPNLILDGLAPSVLGAYVRAALRGEILLPKAEACRAYARQRFDWPVVAANVRRVYEEVLA